MEKIRINKYLAQLGVASRRKVDELIREGRVTVGGTRGNVGDLVSEGDEVRVDGRLVKKAEQLVYIMLNKPVGVVTTVQDEQGRKTVIDLIAKLKNSPVPVGTRQAKTQELQTNKKLKAKNIVETRLFPVGRLDIDSEGLVLLTNDGELAYRLTHPKFEIPKTYEVVVEGTVTNNAITQLRKGVRIGGKLTAPAGVRILERRGDLVRMEFVIREGRNRQVRRMCRAVNLEVVRLKRVAMGVLRLGELGPSKWRELTGGEVTKLLRY